MKKMTRIFLVLIFISILLGGIFFITKNNKNFLKINNVKNDSFNKDNEESSETDTKSLSGWISRDTGEEDSNCQIKQITYSMINFNKSSVCNQQQENICIDKTVSCSIEVHNRDDGVQGFFEIELRFIKEGGEKEDAFEVKISEFSLSPETSKFVTGSTNIQSQGIDGLANQQINCFYNTLEVPQKEIC